MAVAIATSLMIAGAVGHSYLRRSKAAEQVGMHPTHTIDFQFEKDEATGKVKITRPILTPEVSMGKVRYHDKKNSPLWAQWQKPYHDVPMTTQMSTVNPRLWTKEFAEKQTRLDVSRPLWKSTTLDLNRPLGINQPFISKGVLPLRQATVNKTDLEMHTWVNEIKVH